MEQEKATDRPRRDSYDAVVVGSGPNGLAAAITLAGEGRSVLVVERGTEPGGGMRSRDDLTLPGFVHDVCSAVHPMALASPFFSGLPLADRGLEWVHPTVPLAHPLEGGRAAVMYRDVRKTALALDVDRPAYEDLFEPLVRDAEKLFGNLLRPPLGIPRNPIAVARFGWNALRSAKGLVRRFETEEARALFAGNAAHSVLPLEAKLTAAVGMMLAVAGHHVGWPVAKGGSGALAAALVGHLRALGGEVVCGWEVDSLDELPEAKAYLLDLAPPGVVKVAGERLPESYRNQLAGYRFGPGVFKIDYALSAPIPWEAAEAHGAGTVHVGGTFEEVAASERACWGARAPEKPFVLVAQQSVFDETRAPEGKQVAWAYCHVPPGCQVDMRGAIEAQIERFAPGFRDCVLESKTMGPADYERYNPNCVGGDIVGGVQDFRQFIARPVLRLNPYATPAKDIFLCSASTPPGAGVHGMCGYHAARAALRKVLR